MKTITITFIEFADIKESSKHIDITELTKEDIECDIPESDLVIFNPCTWKRKSLLTDSIKDILMASGDCCETNNLNKIK